MMEEKKRLDYPDIAKAIALLLVIVGHSFRDEARVDSEVFRILYDIIYRFQSSALMLISGICFGISRSRKANEQLRTIAIGKARSYLLPFFTYSMIVYAAFSIAYCIPGIGHILQSTSFTLVSFPKYLLAMLRNENPYSFHLWYLSTLYLLTMSAFAIDRFTGPAVRRPVCVILIVIAPLASALILNGTVWTIKGYAHQLPIFLTGTLLTDDTLRRYRRPLLITGSIAFILSLLQIALFRDIDFLGEIGREYYIRLSALLISLGLVAFAMTLERPLVRLAHLGRRSMPVYLYHQPVCCALLGTVLYSYMKLPAAFVMLLCIALSLTVPFLLCRLIRLLQLEKIAARIGLPY